MENNDGMYLFNKSSTIVPTADMEVILDLTLLYLVVETSPVRVRLRICNDWSRDLNNDGQRSARLLGTSKRFNA